MKSPPRWPSAVSDAAVDDQRIVPYFMRPSQPGQDSEAAQHIDQLLKLIEPGNETELREGLRDTPSRVAKAFTNWFGGYYVDVGKILSTQFQDRVS